MPDGPRYSVGCSVTAPAGRSIKRYAEPTRLGDRRGKRAIRQDWLGYCADAADRSERSERSRQRQPRAFARASSKGRAPLQKRFGQLLLIIPGQPARRCRLHVLLVPLDFGQVMPAFQGPFSRLAWNRCRQRSTLQPVEAASCRVLVSRTRLEAASTAVFSRDHRKPSPSAESTASLPPTPAPPSSTLAKSAQETQPKRHRATPLQLRPSTLSPFTLSPFTLSPLHSVPYT